uniref:Uncharacterized protein n=1 Tax=Graphocephala atropunctata TaxID=36148 RepID=A0A1B6L5Y3_9HEMI
MERFYLSVLVITAVYITHCTIQTIKRGNSNDAKTVQTFVLNVSESLHHTSKFFLSFSIDSREIRDGLCNPSLRNAELIRLTSYLAPGYLRVGGIEANRLVFEEESSVLEPKLKLNPNDTFYMSGSKWTEIYTFAEQSGLKILFDLNVLLRNHSHWNSSNAKSLIDFSASKGYQVDWQLGNEPNAFQHNFNVTLSPSQLAEDFSALRHLLNSYPTYHKALVVGPDVTSPRRSPQEVTMPAERFLQKFLDSGGKSYPVDVVAWHHYYLHWNATMSDFLSPAVFDSLEEVMDIIKDVVERSRLPLWIAESGSASGGGVAGVSDRFAASFSLLDRLGVCARRGLNLVVRQSLYAGHYALIHRTTLRPNP